MNMFRCTPDKSLDKVYLRTCAVYKLLKQRKIGKQRAIELLTIQESKYTDTRKNLVELWLAHPLKHLA